MEQRILAVKGVNFLDIVLNDDERFDVEFQERPNMKMVMYIHVDGRTIVRALMHEHQVVITKAEGDYREEPKED